jgi:hypothetical protein
MRSATVGIPSSHGWLAAHAASPTLPRQLLISREEGAAGMLGFRAKARHHVAQLAKLGFRVELQTIAQAA